MNLVRLACQSGSCNSENRGASPVALMALRKCRCCSGVERQRNRVAGCDGIAAGWMDEYLPCRIFSVETQSWLDVQH